RDASLSRGSWGSGGGRMTGPVQRVLVLASVVAAVGAAPVPRAWPQGRQAGAGSVSPLVAEAVDLGRAASTAQPRVVAGLARHYAALEEPTFPADIADAVVGVIGLDDLVERQPRVRASGPDPAPHAALGSNCCHLSPNDLATFYDNTTAYTGTGQTIVIAGAY